MTSALAPGDITTSEPLVGELGFISSMLGEPLRVGLDLSPAAPASSVLSFDCGGPPELGGEAWMVEGSVIGRIRPLDRMTSSYQLTFKARGAEQLPQAFQGGLPDTLTARRSTGIETREEALGLTLRGERSAIEGHGEEALEFKARVRAG